MNWRYSLLGFIIAIVFYCVMLHRMRSVLLLGLLDAKKTYIESI